MKILHMEIKSCYGCPFADQDEYDISCYNSNVSENGYATIMTNQEHNNGQTLKKKYNSEFPPFCPLPNKKE